MLKTLYSHLNLKVTLEKNKKLNYTIIGKGMPVIFIHGFLENNAMWENIIPNLKGIKTICIELPGHGKSALSSENETIVDWACAINRIIELVIPNESFSIVGHSLGGYVSLELAKLVEEKIKSLCLLHSHPWADSEKKQNDRMRVTKIVAYDKSLFIKEAIPELFYEKEKYKDEISQLISDAMQMDKLAIIQVLKIMAYRAENIQILMNLGKKAHVIQGEFDALIEAKKMVEFCNVANVNYHLIKNVGHMGQIEAKNEVINYIQNFVSK